MSESAGTKSTSTRAPRTTRRRFLALGGLALVAGPLWLRCRPRSDDALARRFEEHFSYLDIAREDLLRFFDDYEEALGPIGDPEGRDLPFVKFLESTDFFLHGADESRPVRYVMLRDPYVNPCFNPLIERG